MSQLQIDLFEPSRSDDRPSDEIVASIRVRLVDTLAMVKSAETMPWDDQLAIIREDNAFRFGTSVLPSNEGATLWAEFDREMDRLYALMNDGKEVDLGD